MNSKMYAAEITAHVYCQKSVMPY